MRQRTTLTVAMVLPLVACASGATGTTARPAVQPEPTVAAQSGASSVAGPSAHDYVLVSVNGHALPDTLAASEDEPRARREVVGGALTFANNGTFAISTTYRDVTSQNQRPFDSKFSGVSSPDGDGFHMYWDGGGDTRFTVRGDTVAMDNEGVLFRYLPRH
jgi:hypothetical protein